MRDRPDAVMLFAAGFGTRMGALTADCPKPLIKVAGKALVDHTIELTAAIKPQTLVANTHYLADQMADHLTPQGIQCSHESPDILETGGGLKQALPMLGNGPIYTANTDAIWNGPNPFELLQDAWEPDRMDGLLLCVPLANTYGHSRNGDFLIAEDGQISRGPGVVYGGVQIIRTEGLADISDKAFSLNLLWNKMIKNNRLFGLSYPGQWCDVGSPAGIVLAEKLIEGSDV